MTRKWEMSSEIESIRSEEKSRWTGEWTKTEKDLKEFTDLIRELTQEELWLYIQMNYKPKYFIENMENWDIKRKEQAIIDLKEVIKKRKKLK